VRASSAQVRIEGPKTLTLEHGEHFDSASTSAPPAETPPEEAPTPLVANEKTTPAPKKSKKAPVSQRELYERAKQLSGKKAVAMFDRAGQLEGPLTELSLYQAARIELTSGRPGRALTRFEQLAQKFPAGTLARETRLAALECKLELGRLEEAQRELDGYLARYPDTERRADLRFLRAELYRKLGDCNRAFVDYGKVREGPRAEDAIYLTAWCADRIGKADVAKMMLGEYLRRFPNGRHAEQAKGYLAVGRWSDEKK